MPSDSFDSAVLDVRGMWCTSCANALERVLRRHAGVLDAKVNFASESALVQWDPAATSLRDLLAGTAQLGYECVPDGENHDRGAHFAKIKDDLFLRLVVALFFSMWVMVAQWSLYLAPTGSMSASAQYWLAGFAGLTAVPVMGHCAAPVFRAARRARAAGWHDHLRRVVPRLFDPDRRDSPEDARTRRYGPGCGVERRRRTARQGRRHLGPEARRPDRAERSPNAHPQDGGASS